MAEVADKTRQCVRDGTTHSSTSAVVISGKELNPYLMLYGIPLRQNRRGGEVWRKGSGKNRAQR